MVLTASFVNNTSLQCLLNERLPPELLRALRAISGVTNVWLANDARTALTCEPEANQWSGRAFIWILILDEFGDYKQYFIICSHILWTIFFQEACKMSQVHTLNFDTPDLPINKSSQCTKMRANGQVQSGCLKGIWLGVQKGSLAKWLAILFLPSMLLKSRNRLKLIHELMIKWLTLGYLPGLEGNP